MLTRRDRAVVGGLILALVALSAAVVWPAIQPTTAAPASPSPEGPVAVRPYREGLLGRPSAVNPFGARTNADRALVSLVFAGLVRLGPGESFVPDLAERWSVDDTAATWTFRLRADATWHDGEPVTAADVGFTIRALQDPDYTGPGSTSWRDVTVTEIDERTVRFRLAHPIGGFLSLATQPIAPAHLLDGVPAAALPTNPFGQQPVGNGPYRLVSWNAGEAILEAAVPAIPVDATPIPTPSGDSLASPTATPIPARPYPYIPRMEFRFSMRPADLSAAYRAGDLDVVAGLEPDDALALAEQPRTRLLRYPRSTLTALLFDQRAARTEFRDARTRLGLLQAIDRDRIVADRVAGLGIRADSPIPPRSWAFDPSTSPAVRFDREAAVKSLTDAGWKRLDAGGWSAPGATTAYRLELLTPDAASNPVVNGVAEAIAEDWRAIGLTVDVLALPPTELVDGRLREGAFAAALVDVMIGLDPDLYPLLASTQTVAGGPNVSGVQDATLDARLVAARQPGTDEARRTAYRDLQSYLSANVFMGPIAWRDEVVVTRESLMGPSVRRLGEGADRFYDVLTWRLASDR
jgi:peptide/nickel transport system substrate-binding protein